MNEQAFLDHVQELGGLADHKEARAWTLAVLSALGHLLPDAEARRRFATQLPGGLKAAVRDESPAGMTMGHDALVQHIAATLDIRASGGERALRAVYGVLREAVAPGQLADIEARLPVDVVRAVARSA